MMITLAYFSLPDLLLVLAVLVLLFPALFLGKRGLGGLAHQLGRLTGSLTGGGPQRQARRAGGRAADPELSAEALVERYRRTLGLTGPITPEAIKARWRELSRQYHPDYVQHLGPKLRAVAEQEMKAINEAYRFFCKKYGL